MGCNCRSKNNKVQSSNLSAPKLSAPKLSVKEIAERQKKIKMRILKQLKKLK